MLFSPRSPLSLTPGVSEFLTKPMWSSEQCISLPSSYVRVLTPSFLDMWSCVGFFIENKVKMRTSRWVLIQDGCRPYKNGELSRRFMDKKEDHFEHEGSHLQAQESNLGQNFFHRPQKETCRHLGLRLELQNCGFCCSHSFLTLTEQGVAIWGGLQGDFLMLICYYTYHGIPKVTLEAPAWAVPSLVSNASKRLSVSWKHSGCFSTSLGSDRNFLSPTSKPVETQHANIDT